MEDVHQMVCADQSAAEVLFACIVESCGRRVVVGKREPRFTVLDKGRAWVRHVGSLGGVAMTTELGQT